MIADIGLIFLDQPVLDVTPLALPDTNLAGCDPETNRPYIGVCDSGSPLLLNNSTVVGVRDTGEGSCPGFSCGTRVDNPKILKWINNCISSRLGTKIKWLIVDMESHCPSVGLINWPPQVEVKP